MPDEATSVGLQRAGVPEGTSRPMRDRSSVFRQRQNGTIACVIDDHAGAEAALHVARRLAERFDARMLLVALASGAGGSNEGVTALQAQAGAERRLQRLAAEHDLGDEEQRIAAGDPAETVARIAAEEAADLIVVGARRGLSARTLRSLLAADLAATASCPVVVAHPRYRNTNERTHRTGN